MPYWLDQPGAPEPMPALAGHSSAGLAVVGGGFTGLWTALLAKEQEPARRRPGRRPPGGVGRHRPQRRVLLGQHHSRPAQWPGPVSGRDRHAGATRSAQAERDREDHRPVRDRLRLRAHRGAGRGHQRLAAGRAAPHGDSRPRPWRRRRTAGRRGRPRRAALADLRWRPVGPRRLRDRGSGPAGLGPAPGVPGAGGADLRAHPGHLDRRGAGCRSRPRRPGPHHWRWGWGGAGTIAGTVAAQRVALGSGAFAPQLRRLRNYLVPVYDYVLMSEPLSASQLASIGWQHRQGIGDSPNQFHYYRLTADNRILWGGYDAVYHNGGRITAAQDQRPGTFALLASQFFTTFPQLADIRFSHAWGGVIDTCARFCAFYGTAHEGRLAYAAGYTGLGVGASRFGANVMLDLLAGQPSELTELSMVRSKPLPFPPEPVRSAVIQLTRASLARADRNEGRRDLWLRTLDRLGLGFDS